MTESEEQQHQQSSDFPTAGYEAAEQERQSLQGEKEEQQSPEPTKQQKGKRRGKQRGSTTTTIGAADSAWQMTLFDLDKQLTDRGRLWKDGR
jgi:hypothetical protein